jgi:hypothetical protein
VLDPSLHQSKSILKKQEFMSLLLTIIHHHPLHLEHS